MLETRLSLKPLVACFLILGFGLSACGGEELPKVGQLIAQLQSDNPDQIKRAAILLGKHGPRAATAVPALLDAAALDEEELRKKTGKKAKAADKGKKQDNSKLYDTIVRALSRTGKAGIPDLIKGLEHPEQRSSWAAMTALAWVGKPAVPALTEALQGDNNDVKDLAATSLAAIGKPAAPAIPALVETARGRFGSASGQSVVALGKIGGDAVPALLELLDDPKMGPRRADVITAIGQVGGAAKPAVPTLLDSLKDPDDKIQLATVRALGQIGPAAEAAIPSLMRLEKGQTQIAKVANKALDQIAPER